MILSYTSIEHSTFHFLRSVLAAVWKSIEQVGAGRAFGQQQYTQARVEKRSQRWWIMPVILATRAIEIGRIAV
jgi:hypothetical protein